MKRTAKIIAAIALLASTYGTIPVHAQSNPPSIVVVGQTAGPTPFISLVQVAPTGGGGLKSVGFEVAPKPGSVTRPVSAVYFTDYLQSRGYVDTVSGQVTVPVFGLYADYSNAVKLTYRFNDGSSQRANVTIATAPYSDEFGYSAPQIIQARTSSTALSYDYLILKSAVGTKSPIIIDTDGAIRWVGTTGRSYLSSIFEDNSFFVPLAPSGSTARTGIARLELDGTYQFVADYGNIDVTSTAHHNYDPGKQGILVAVDTVNDVESAILEVDTAGKILKTWNFADIIIGAMIAGGDDPTLFISRGADWFHHNSTTYRKSDNTLIVSSRENFVIAVDYDTSAIKWILGDPTKHWYQFASLRQYALELDYGTQPPIGQHALSITHDDELLLFDNGTYSAYEMPRGVQREYSAPRKYRIDTQRMTAGETWNYLADYGIYSAFTSSIYEDDAENYLINYADKYVAGVQAYAELVGLDASGAKVFDYQYPTGTPAFAWNAIPIHFEDLVFTGPSTKLAANHPKFFTGEVALSDGVYYLAFPENGNVFGYYSYLNDPRYIYHFGLGYEYRFDTYDSQNGSYFYDFASGSVFYTSPRFPFPYLYDFSLETVLYYFGAASPASPGQRIFYNFATQQFITK